MEIDETNQRVLVALWNETQDRWGCKFCLEQGALTILDSEAELVAHADEVHPTWRQG